MTPFTKQRLYLGPSHDWKVLDGASDTGLAFSNAPAAAQSAVMRFPDTGRIEHPYYGCFDTAECVKISELRAFKFNVRSWRHIIHPEYEAWLKDPRGAAEKQEVCAVLAAKRAQFAQLPILDRRECGDGAETSRVVNIRKPGPRQVSAKSFMRRRGSESEAQFAERLLLVDPQKTDSAKIYAGRRQRMHGAIPGQGFEKGLNSGKVTKQP